MKNTFYLLLLALALAGCGKDKTEAPGSGGGAEAPKPSPARDFSSVSGVTEEGGQMVCPYEELAGYYKLSSSECSQGGAKAELDNVIVPTRYTVAAYPDAGSRGYVELQYTGDGADVLSQALDFPRLPSAATAKTLGLQCALSGDGETLSLKQACPGTSGKDCFYSIVKKGSKVAAYVSQMRKGSQYWCKVNLRKADLAQ